MSHDDTLKDAVRLIESGLCKEAVEKLKALLDDNPDSLEGWYNLGIAYHECEEREEADKAYDEALAIDNQIVDIWFNKGNVLYELADFKKAIECYEKALEINEEDAEIWNNLGNAYSRIGEGQQAIEAYTRAVAVRPDYAEAYYNKANAHFIEGEDERAITYAELAMKLDPSLGKLVSKWIHVAKDRLAARDKDEEYKRRISEESRKLMDIE